jgi:sec-independent protein translocase protein TatB
MLSIPHMIVVFIVVLVVFGPQKLPELARGLGKLMAEFRKASTDFKSAFEEEMRDMERQARAAEWKKQTATESVTTQNSPESLETPASAEMQVAQPTADSGQKEAQIIMPPPESIAHSSGHAMEETPEGNTESAAQVPSTEEAPADSSSSAREEPIHDKQQPA